MVLGLGASGFAAARLLRREGVEVVAMDKGMESALRERCTELENLGVSVRLGDEATMPPAADMCVVSPGIATDSEWVTAVKSGRCPVLSELSLGAARLSCPVLAITGTNGKSTVAKLCVEALRAAGKRAEMAGNCMPPLSDVVAESPLLDWVVVEVSSFQMEHPGLFHPDIAVMLNVQPDHLDRHGSMETYRMLKSRVFARQRGNDSAVVFAPDAASMRRYSKGQGGWITFGESGADVVYCDGLITDCRTSPPVTVNIAGSYFDNPVLGLSACAAVAALRPCGVQPEAIERAIRSFHPLAHRMEVVRMVRGVQFIDDSKGTNLAAMCAALRMVRGPVRLIAGGLLKEDNFEFAKDLLEKRVTSVYLIGSASKRMYESWHEHVDCKVCGDLDTAVKQAFADSRKGETVLLSPGGASFDQFRSYAHRGEKFRKIVEAINE